MNPLSYGGRPCWLTFTFNGLALLSVKVIICTFNASKIFIKRYIRIYACKWDQSMVYLLLAPTYES